MWCVVCGVWCVMRDVWCVMRGAWCVARGAWKQVLPHLTLPVSVGSPHLPPGTGRTAPPTASYADATEAVGSWWESDEGVPAHKVADMDAFFASIEDRPVRQAEVISEGSPWGKLHETLLGGVQLAPGATFFHPSPSPATAEAALWRELAETGNFSAATLALAAPPSYAVDRLWVGLLERSAGVEGGTWLHKLLLAVAYAESGEVARPRRLLQSALTQQGGARSPLVPRTLAVLESDPEAAWNFFQQAWNLTARCCGSWTKPSPPSMESDVRLTQNVLDEILKFVIGNLAGATDGVGRSRSTTRAAYTPPSPIRHLLRVWRTD